MVFMTAPEISKRLKEIYRSFSGPMDIFSVRLLEHSRTKITCYSQKDIEKVRLSINLMACMLNTKYLLEKLFCIMDWNVLYLVNQAIKDSIDLLNNEYRTLECDVPEDDSDFFEVYSCFSLDSLQNS